MCPHGNQYRKQNRHGGYFCAKCWEERKNKGPKALHDKKRRPYNPCSIHGPHYVITGSSGHEFCLACGPSDRSKLSPCSYGCYKCNHCKICEQETKRQHEIDDLEKITRPTYQEMAGKLDEIENFTRIKNAT